MGCVNKAALHPIFSPGIALFSKSLSPFAIYSVLKLLCSGELAESIKRCVRRSLVLQLDSFGNNFPPWTWWEFKAKYLTKKQCSGRIASFQLHNQLEPVHKCISNTTTDVLWRELREAAVVPFVWLPVRWGLSCWFSTVFISMKRKKMHYKKIWRLLIWLSCQNEDEASDQDTNTYLTHIAQWNISHLILKTKNIHKMERGKIQTNRPFTATFRDNALLFSLSHHNFSWSQPIEKVAPSVGKQKRAALVRRTLRERVH